MVHLMHVCQNTTLKLVEASRGRDSHLRFGRFRLGRSMPGARRESVFLTNPLAESEEAHFLLNVKVLG